MAEEPSTQPEISSMPNPETQPPPDELADFFGAGEADVAKAQELLADITEANKSGQVRHREIIEAIANSENPTVKQARELGTTLVKGLTGEVGLSEIKMVLGEDFSAKVQYAETVDVDAVRGVLAGEVESLSHSIFSDLTDAQATATIGAQRRIGQQRLITLQATLLGMAEESFRSGDYERGFADLQSARMTTVTSQQPAWFLQTMADAVALADLNDPVVRQTLIKASNSSGFYFPQDMQTRVKEKPIEELVGMEVLHKKILEAKEIEARIAAEQREAQLKAEYEEKMKVAWERKMAGAVADGSSQFRMHFEGGDNFMVRFSDWGGGSAMLKRLVMGNREIHQEATDGRQLGGAMGYLQVLENILEKPGLLDRIVAIADESSVYDLGGKQKRQYEAEGRMTEWQDQIRGQIKTEIYGNALGVLEGAIEYEGPKINDAARANLLRKALEVLGGGRALEGIIAGRGELTEEQQLVRRALLEYVKNPIREEERLGDRADEVANLRLARLKGLRDIAAQADVVVGQRRQEAKRQAEQKAQEEDKRRADLREKVDISQKHLQEIDEAKEAILDVKAKTARIVSLGQAPLEEYLKVNRDDRAKPPALNISVDEVRAQEVNDRILQLKEELARDPNNTQLRVELAGRETDQRFIQELGRLVDMVNSPLYKRVFKTAGGAFGIGSKSLGAILHTAFDNISRVTTSYVYDQDIDEVIRQIAEPKAMGYNQSKPKTLLELKEEVVAWVRTEDLLATASGIIQTEQDLSRRAAQVKEALRKLLQQADEATAGAARELIKSRLSDQLRREHRIAYR